VTEASVSGLLASRRGEHVLEWAAGQVGGTVVSEDLHGRWRPMWSLDVERLDGEVVPLLLRGFREPIIGPDEPDQRRRLRREAKFLESLQDTDVRVARYHRSEPEGDWLLMERVAGTPDLTKVDDVARQADLFRQYLADVAKLNQLDWEKLDLPKDFQIAVDYEDGISRMLHEFRAMGYDSAAQKLPEPLVAFCDWWLVHHPPAPVDRFSVCSGDVGPDQLLFEGDHYRAMFDLEMVYVGDPLQDMGQRPDPVTNSFTKYHDWLEGELREYHLPRAGDNAQFPVAWSLALAATARLCATIGPELVRQNVADLTRVLGAQPTDEMAGLAELEARVRNDPEADIEGLLRATYAIAARHEFVLAPIQALCGFASGMPMERFDWSV